MLDEVMEISTSGFHKCSQHVYCKHIFVCTEWGTCIRHQSTGTARTCYDIHPSYR